MSYHANRDKKNLVTMRKTTPPSLLQAVKINQG